jgi:Phytanoyl-CoA dioxygenase (PhyH)
MLFKDEQQQRQLEKNGYVVVPLLSHLEIESLNRFYNELHPEGSPPDIIEGIHMTTWCKDAAYKQRVADFLSNLFADSTERYFNDYRRLNNVFIIKKSGKDTTFKVHQDWNVVDETKFESVNVWVPLHDVDESSGALWVLPGSHKIKRKIRGAGYLFPDYSPFFPELEKKSISVKLKAGEAIVFYHSIIHGSPPNMAITDRKAACFSVVPNNAPLCIYFQPSEKDALQQFEPGDDFIYHYDYLRTESTQRPPAASPVKTMPPYINKKVDLKELNQFLNPSKSIFSFLQR